MSARNNYFYAKIPELDSPPECFYNAYQNGLYYKNIPNGVYVDEENKKYYSGLKQMKDNTRCTLMVCS